MAEERFIEIRVENEDEIKAKLRAHEMRMQRQLRDLLDNFSELGRAIVAHNVPVFHGMLRENVDRTPVTWRPGGAGGGGYYEAAYGVKRGPGIGRYPLYVEFGTGLYGPQRRYIVPQRATHMVFYSHRYRRVIRTTRTRGQRAQRFFYISWREFEVYAAARLFSLDLLH